MRMPIKISWLGALTVLAALMVSSMPAVPQKKPNVVVLMADDVGSYDIGAFGGDTALGHPTLNIDRLAKEGVILTNWYGQASCRASPGAHSL
jgi:arylsulfatase A-like enzyme